MEINTIALRAFYKTHKDEYYRRRSSSDSTLWDEQYKWDILPALNARLTEYTAITRSNVAEFIAVINSADCFPIGGIVRNNFAFVCRFSPPF